MKNSNSIKGLIVLLITAGLTIYFAACNNNSVTNDNQTDDEYLRQVVTTGPSSISGAEDNLMSNESTDIDDGGAVGDNGSGMSPIDSLKRWGRKVLTVNVNITITNYGDTVKAVQVTRTITGVFIIRGYSGGVPDSVNKPYTEVFTRTLEFKRVARTEHPRLNWRVYKVSMVDGQTTSPQTGKDQIKINNISVYVNGGLTPAYSFNGPDFSQNIFTTMYFGGTGIPKFRAGDQVRVVVTLNSNQPDTDYVAWHWARNSFGFHRVPFVLTSSPILPDRTYEKTFNIFTNHPLGVFNGYISANTRQSLWDDNPALFSSTTAGTPYIIY
jgi:hypothetical protein